MAALEELELAAFGAVEEALRTSGVQAHEVGAHFLDLIKSAEVAALVSVQATLQAAAKHVGYPISRHSSSTPLQRLQTCQHAPCHRQVDFLVSACSSVVLVPSLAAMVANRFGMRRDTVSYALGGMACSSGVIAVDLARRLMQVP